jgi:hypothetical protein
MMAPFWNDNRPNTISIPKLIKVLLICLAIAHMTFHFVAFRFETNNTGSNNGIKLSFLWRQKMDTAASQDASIIRQSSKNKNKGMLQVVFPAAAVALLHSSSEDASASEDRSQSLCSVSVRLCT